MAHFSLPQPLDPFVELVEEEAFRLSEVAELPAVLGGDDGCRAAPEVVVVGVHDSGVVVGELLLDLCVDDGGASGGVGKLHFFFLACGGWV